MRLKPIRTKREYQAALNEVEMLWNAPDGSPEGDRLDVLVLLIEAYEREHFPIAAPEPIDLLLHVIEARSVGSGRVRPSRNVAG